jgi:Tol biopolymer transport system component/tRNA A-37 threonylcarbamoyl transferase component Bud32
VAGASANFAVPAAPAECSACGAALAAGRGPCARCLLHLGLAETPPPPGDPGALAVPGRVGPFALLDAIGEGGMGIVYLAEQQHPVRRRVALKVMKWGLDFPSTLARLEAERQALASLNHPGIAQLFEAGTTEDGRPYFAMEHVEGGPLTRRCDELRLPVERRLRLFQAVCAAVDHAHGRGIVHRDLKPTNILLAGDADAPAVKVIDFGLAKAIEGRLTDRTASTRVGVLLGTPAYMAPEQADPRRPEVGPAADVYALGVVLYELLSGLLPFDAERLRRDPVEMVRILREEEPRSLSSLWTRPVPDGEEIARRRGTDARSLRRLLRGELSWIVHRCLEKDPRRRYPGARALADDIERLLTHRPVEARRPGVACRAGKLVRRHRTATSAVAAALATLALAAGGLPLVRRDDGSAPIEQVTTSGVVRGAGVSPSGRYVLYHERSRGTESVLWLADRDSGALERLPDMPGPPVNSEHRFSRDERHLYVKSHGMGGRQPLHRLALDGGRWEDLWSDPPEGATLSPDETRVAGVRNDPRTAQSRLVVADPRGRLETTVCSRGLDAPYDFLAWSPDGLALAATVGNRGAAGGPVGVVEVDVGTGRERPIGPQDWIHAQAKAWLPDGSALLVVGHRRGEPEMTRSLYRLDRETGEIRRIPMNGLRPSGWNLSLSGDGRTLAICAVRFRAGLWVLPFGDSSRAREVAVAVRSPRFLPDGGLLYAGAEGHLWMLRPRGGTTKVARDAYDGSPTPDGRDLVVTLVRGGVPHVYRTDAAGRNPVRLSHAPAGDPAVAPDGSYALYVTAADEKLWKVPLRGGPPVLLSSRPATFPAISPDGRWIAAIDPGRALPARVRLLAAGGGDERILDLPPGAAESPSALRFSPDGTALDYARSDESGVGNLWRRPLDGGPDVQLTRFTAEPLTGFDWSADGHTLACLRGGWQGDAYLVRGDW